ncbi:unnamed protein product [Paramecium octaurelia]|uniref:Uncharacterized protein n=1 Tax=Paramecium octaurelia TaxID=43137 RepID=A0A8S1TYK9_PAROT|nr:unnamed protein product [Paramecium octaurelia]
MLQQINQILDDMRWTMEVLSNSQLPIKQHNQYKFECFLQSTNSQWF